MTGNQPRLDIFFVSVTLIYIQNFETGSRHSSYTSHQSRISYTSHGDLLGGITKESRLRSRSSKHAHPIVTQPLSTANINYVESNHKGPYVRNKIKFLTYCL